MAPRRKPCGVRRRLPVLLVAIGVAAAGCASHHRSGLMTWDEYRRWSSDWPYVLRFDTPQGTLLYFGSRHTYSPDDPQVERIERLWTCFRPTMAFNEGGNPPVQATRDTAVERCGEAGLVRFLGARDDVPVASLDPDRAEEAAHLRKSFPARQVKLTFMLRGVSQFVERRGTDGAEAELQRVLGIVNQLPGQGGYPRTPAEVAEGFAQMFPGGGDYRRVPPAWFDPVRSDTVFNRISRASSEYRDRAMIEILRRSVADGQRVFAVVGGTHVVMQEQALGTALGVRGRRLRTGCR